MAEAKLDITDELLVAYVDDELDAAERALVSSVLASSPALCRRAEAMRLSRDLLREAFPLRPDASIPAPVEAAANRLAEACAQRFSQPRVEPRFRSGRKSARTLRKHARRVRRYAIAAGLALCVVAATFLAWRAGVDSAGRAPVAGLMQIRPGTQLHDVLESSPSSQVIDVPAEGAAVRAVLTFRAKDGRFCREFEILAASGGATGIACRRNGRWSAEVLLSTTGASTSSNGYTPAEGSDDPTVAEVADRLIEGDALGAAEEASALASGWRASGSP